MKIGLVGSSKSGKDFLTELIKKHKHEYKSIAFADSLKTYCDELYPGIEKYNTPELKDKIINEVWNKNRETAREIWLRVSREMAVKDDKFFYRKTMASINNLLKETENNLIVTDIRNKYEYTELLKLGFTVIYIIRPGQKIFQGYDKRIEEFYKDIPLTYVNTNEQDFIKYISNLEKGRE